ncbi:MAG: PocR ligand-binding domain-containing protein [Kiritimatiellae bacterium]|nr:PocR ligand-binding domain-containing protein [Kiritimatiellia bacterium]
MKKAKSPAKTQDASPLSPSSTPNAVVDRRFRCVFFALALICIATIGPSCWVYYKRQQAETHRTATETLAAIADLKVNQIAGWIKNRHNNANIIFKTHMVWDEIQQFFTEPDDAANRDELLKWMTTFQQDYDYSQVILFDAHGAARLAVPADASLLQDSHIDEHVGAALHAREVVFEDLHHCHSNQLTHLSFLIPFGINSQADQPADGVLLLVVDPQRFLYPLIQSWPTPSSTAKTLLVRREDNEVVFLNDLRHRTNAALALRIPINDPNRPAAKAVQGKEGVVEGVDCRGIPVLAALRKIPGTPWFLVTKVDQKEIYGPLRKETWATAAIIALLLLTAMLSVGLLWRKQMLKFSRRELARQKKEETRLRTSEERWKFALEGAGDGVWDMEIPTKTVRFSKRWKEILGYAESEIANLFKEWEKIVHPDDLAGALANFQNYLADRTPIYVNEFRMRCKDGSYKWILSRGMVVSRDAAGQPLRMVGTHSDITERKQTEEALRQSETTIRNKLKAIIEPDGDIGTLELADIIDTNVLQSIMEEFYQMTGMLGAVLDLSGNILVAVGWQDICTKFHRAHPESCKNCLESDTCLTKGVAFGTFKAYHCKNHMWDMVTPLMIGDQHVGNVFTGQFFYTDETPDVELFRKQARKYGFDETEYLAAFEKVPRFSRQEAEAGMRFYSKLSAIISTLSFSAIQQSRMLSELQRAEAELIKYRDHLEELVTARTAEITKISSEQQVILDSVRAMIWFKDTEGRILRVNRTASESVGMTVADIEGKTDSEIFPDEAERFRIDDLEVIQSGQPKLGIIEPLHTAAGDTHWYITDKIPHRDAAGNIAGVIVFCMDITEKKLAEEKAARRTAELKKIVSAMAGRENRMVELKKVNESLRSQVIDLGHAPVESAEGDFE